MFIRKKLNKSGTVSVFVLSTTKSRKQRLVKSFGSAHPNDTASLEKLMQQASSFIQEMEGPSLPHIYEEEEVIDGFVSSLNNAQVQVAGPELVFGTLYDRIGYGAIRNRMFRNIVMCRLFNPGSKLKTVDYMERYLHVTYSVDQIYRFLDNLCYRKEAEEKSNDVRKPETAEGEGEPTSTSPAKPWVSQCGKREDCRPPLRNEEGFVTCFAWLCYAVSPRVSPGGGAGRSCQFRSL